MINKLSLSGFKGFKNKTVAFNKLTLLAGGNGAGKTSIIQALILFRLGYESRLNGTHDQVSDISINHGYNLSIGSIYELFGDDSNMLIEVDGNICRINPTDSDTDNQTVRIGIPEKLSSTQPLSSIFKKEFYYLEAERVGPRLISGSNFSNFIHCGYQGEYTADVLQKYQLKNVEPDRCFDDEKVRQLLFQTEQWIDFIFPGTNLLISPIDPIGAQIKIANNISKKALFATNIGFGISYVLPIIVTSLLAKKDSIFIVENPEVHLHPKAQSSLGYFLAKIAGTGVQVIIETHSEHIINGVRRAVLSNLGLNPEDVTINFFKIVDSQISVEEIKINKSGDLSDFPLDFFDQSRQDLLEIIRLARGK